MGSGATTTLPCSLRRAAALAVRVGVALVCSGAPALAAPPPPPLDISDSTFAAGLRERVAERAAIPATRPRWFDTADAPPEVVLTPRFVYVRDQALSLPAPPWFGDDAYTAAFELVRGAWDGAQPDRARLLMVFTTFADGGGSLFYLPLANDVGGLGSGKPTERFDDTPGSALDGVAWLGDVDALEAAGDDYFREAFIHEIAHRWAAYVDVAHPELPEDALRGRQSMHWSFLASTGQSPMEGNAWVEQPDGTWVTRLSQPMVFHFSPLDLYLMGVLPPEAVPPFELITKWSVLSPDDVAVTPETAPAHRLGAPVRLWVSERASISIDEIIAASGPRDPPARDEVVTWPVGIVLLSNGLEKASFDELVRLDQRIAELVRDFARATDGRVRLEVSVVGAGSVELGEPCEDVASCDRTRADRCAPIRSGGEPVCTRTCQGDEDCGPGFCCGALPGAAPAGPDEPGAICLAGTRCAELRPPTPPPELDRPTEPAPTPTTEPEIDTEPASSCTAAHAPSGGLGAALLLLACAAGGRRAVRPAGGRRGSRGSPAPARTRRRRCPRCAGGA